MRSLSLLSSQCRHTVSKASPESWMTLASLSFRRHRSGGQSRKNKSSNNKPYWNPNNRNFERFDPQKGYGKYPSPDVGHNRQTGPPYIQKVDPKNIPAFFEEEVKHWSRNRSIPPRLESFGIPQDQVRPLLDAFVRAVTAGELSTPEGHDKYILSRFVHHLNDGDRVRAVDMIYNTILFTWASEPAQYDLLRSAGLSGETICRIQALTEATDRWSPADEYPQARVFHRKIIMHVGPTNSGKTHNALRELAAATTGVYAGPLRLLAHEIWERLNLGQIVPAGVEEKPPNTTPIDTDKEPDASTVTRQGNPEYARSCNMCTGEELRIVEEYAPLTSCTIEMLNYSRAYDVAVIDEIQMIGDPDRGGAWTSALLGLSAKEVHLCGEETAVPIVRALLEGTGDEIIINRYQRLSPLHVQEESLNGDWSQIKKGDCVVSFSRSGIFKLKREIESKTPFRCAVVYGRLPPEIRSEQAALFNDPNSGYDVLIGSDAIGMGLNLKIRRIVFHLTHKWSGRSEEPLSISQTKQIAGRAGRYGLHGKDSPGGYVTTFMSRDIPHIQKALDAAPQPLSNGYLGISTTLFAGLVTALPPGSSTKTILEANYYIGRIPAYLRQEAIINQSLNSLCEFIDSRLKEFPYKERHSCLMAPIAIRDPVAVEVIEKFVTAYEKTMVVDLWKVLDNTLLVANLEQVERLEAEKNFQAMNSDIVNKLESLHKAVVFYVWMTFRRPLSWYCFEEITTLKQRVEKSLDWGLLALTKSQPEHGQESFEGRRAKKTVAYRQWAMDVRYTGRAIKSSEAEEQSSNKSGLSTT